MKKKTPKIKVGLGVDILRYRDGKIKLNLELTTEDFFESQLVYIAISLFKYRIRIGYLGVVEEE